MEDDRSSGATARDVEEQIRHAARDSARRYWVLGQLLLRVRDEKLYVALDFASFRLFLRANEYLIGIRLAYDLLAVAEKYGFVQHAAQNEEERNAIEGAFLRIDVTKLVILGRLIDKDTECRTVLALIDQARLLSRDDLRLAVAAEVNRRAENGANYTLPNHLNTTKISSAVVSVSVDVAPKAIDVDAGKIRDGHVRTKPELPPKGAPLAVDEAPNIATPTFEAAAQAANVGAAEALDDARASATPEVMQSEGAPIIADEAPDNVARIDEGDTDPIATADDDVPLQPSQTNFIMALPFPRREIRALARSLLEAPCPRARDVAPVRRELAELSAQIERWQAKLSQS